jgi:hypothetical protein
LSGATAGRQAEPGVPFSAHVPTATRWASIMQFVCPGDGEEQPDRNAHQQDGILLQTTAAQQRKLDQKSISPLHRREAL